MADRGLTDREVADLRRRTADVEDRCDHSLVKVIARSHCSQCLGVEVERITADTLRPATTKIAARRSPSERARVSRAANRTRPAITDERAS